MALCAWMIAMEPGIGSSGVLGGGQVESARNRLGMSKVRYVLFLVALLSSSSMIILDGIIIPTVNGLYEMFPEDEGLVNFIVTGDYLLVVFISILAGRLCRVMSKKTLIVIGGVMATVGGVFMMAVPDPLFMCVMRAVQAFGIAFSQVCGVAIIAEAFDAKDRDRITGYYYAAMYLFGAAMGPAAGRLSLVSTASAYNLFLMFVPITVLVALFVPKNTTRAADSGSLDASDGGEGPAESALAETGRSRGRTFWVIAVCYMIMYYVLTVRLAYTSVYLAENGLGNAADAGDLEAVYTISSFIGCLVAAFVAERLKSFTFPFAFGCYFMAFAILFLWPALATCFVAYVLCGLGLGVMQTYIYARVPAIVPRSQVESSIAVLVSGTAVTSFLSSYAVSAAMYLMGTDSVTATFIVPAAATAVVVAVSLVERRRWKDEPELNS